MGYITVFSVLNDAAREVRENPQQVADNIYQAMLSINEKDYKGGRDKYVRDYSIGNYCNPMQSSDSQHMDTPQLILVYQNMLHPLGVYSKKYQEQFPNIELRKELLKVAKQLIKQEEQNIKELENK